MAPDETSRKQTRVQTRILVWYSFNQSPLVQSQLVDLSENGMYLNTAGIFEKETVLTLQFQFPHLYPEKNILQGKVIGHTEVIPKVLYHTRIQFNPLEKPVKLAISQYLQNQIHKNQVSSIKPAATIPREASTEEEPKLQKPRKFTRVTVSLEADYYDEIDFSVGAFILADLSAGGARVLSDEALPLNKKVVLKIKLSQNTQRIPVKVCWSHADAETNKIAMGLSFDPFYIKEIEAIQKHLQTLKRTI